MPVIPAALYFYTPPEDLRPAQVHGWPVADDCIFVDSGRDDSVFKALGAAIDEGRATLILSADLVGLQAAAQVRVEWLATRMTRYGGMVWVLRDGLLRPVQPKLLPGPMAAYERRARGRRGRCCTASVAWQVTHGR